MARGGYGKRQHWHGVAMVGIPGGRVAGLVVLRVRLARVGVTWLWVGRVVVGRVI